ncbi:hypothetical protein BsWGS_29185 [Bradybaena similaris]
MVEMEWCFVTVLVLLSVLATVSVVLTTCYVMMRKRNKRQPLPALYPVSTETSSQEMYLSEPQPRTQHQ